MTLEPSWRRFPSLPSISHRKSDLPVYSKNTRTNHKHNDKCPTINYDTTTAPPPPVDPLSKVSPAVLKLKTVSPAQVFSPGLPPQTSPPPTGPYFFYGSLLDPCMLVEILELDVEPELRPASLDGYECKLWGQYPALLAAESGVVDGAVYSVKTAGDAQKLADYETRHYQPVPCVIRYLDGMLPSQEEGYVFMFGGGSEGTPRRQVRFEGMAEADWEISSAGEVGGEEGRTEVGAGGISCSRGD